MISENETKKMNVIHIHLPDSRNENYFPPESTIHEKGILKVHEIVRSLVANIDDKISDRGYREDSVTANNQETVSIFGRRGTGKTSFLMTLIQRLQADRELSGKIKIVKQALDPNLIEGPEIILATVIAKINEVLMEEYKNDCLPIAIGTKLAALASAFRILAPTNSEGHWGKWLGDVSDQDIFAREVLIDAKSGINLAKRVDEYLQACCDALGVKAILLPFDDVDTDLRYGWQTLETLRRYLTSPRLITLISGDLTLYRMLVRSSQWPTLENLVKYEKKIDNRFEEFVSQIEQLEEQYLKKLLPSGFRVYLEPLNERIWREAKSDRNLITLSWDRRDQQSGKIGLDKVFQNFCEEVFLYRKPTDSRESTWALNPEFSAGAKLLPSNARNLCRLLENLAPWAKNDPQQGQDADTAVQNLLAIASTFNHVLSECGISIDDMRRLAYGGQISWLAMTILRVRNQKANLWRLDPNFLSDEKGERLNQLVLLLLAFVHRDWARPGVPLEYCIKVVATNMAASRLRLDKEEIDYFSLYLNLDKDEYATDTVNRLMAYKIFRITFPKSKKGDGESREKCPSRFAGAVRLNSVFNQDVMKRVLDIWTKNRKNSGFREWMKELASHLVDSVEFVESNKRVLVEVKKLVDEIVGYSKRPNSNLSAQCRIILNDYAKKHNMSLDFCAGIDFSSNDVRIKAINYIVAEAELNKLFQFLPMATLGYSKGSFWKHADINSSFILLWFLQRQTIDEFGGKAYFANFASGLASLADVLKVCIHQEQPRNAAEIRWVVTELQLRAAERTSPYEARSSSHESNHGEETLDDGEDMFEAAHVEDDLHAETILPIPESLVNSIASWAQAIQQAKKRNNLPVSVFADIWTRFDNLLQWLMGESGNPMLALGENLERWVIAWFHATLLEEFRYRLNTNASRMPGIQTMLALQEYGFKTNSNSYFKKLKEIKNFKDELPYTHATMCCPIFLACLPRSTYESISDWLGLKGTETDEFLKPGKFTWDFFSPHMGSMHVQPAGMDCHTILCSLVPFIDPEDIAVDKEDKKRFKAKWIKFVRPIYESNKSTRKPTKNPYHS